MNPHRLLARLRAGSAEPWLKLVMVAAVALPLLILVVVAWHEYEQAVARSEQRVSRTTRIAREHALKVFETNDILLRRVLDLTRADGDEALARREQELHDRLGEMAATVREVQAVAVWSADGHVLAHSATYPAPRDLSIADRPYFAAAQARPGELVISNAQRGRISDQVFFVVARSRKDAHGRFAGLVTIALSPAYFTAFYQQLADRESGLAISVVRPDGSVLTRFPDAPAPETRVTAHNPLIPLIGDAEPTPVTIAVSPEDGRRRYVDAQRIGSYPLFVSTDLLQSGVVDDWLRTLWLPAVVAVAAALALLLATWTTLKKTRQEERAVAQWRAEAARRASAERMLSHLSQHLIRVSETEKANLAAELHDELGGALSALALDLAWVLERLKKKAPELVERQSQALKLVHETAALKRRIIDGLRPMLLQHLGLAPALRDYVTQWSKKTGIPVELQLQCERPLPGDAALALFRVVQESLTNVAKYAKAKNVSVAVTEDPDSVCVAITDDGIGISPETLAHPTSHGLTGMQQRVAPFGGTFHVTSEPGNGTRITARLPLPGNTPAAERAPVSADV
ncbi:MAG TPA: ATP-binding protein [Casimicrobiaceae bacterium]|nr:ATP-binding protein [Casimicrobiaceae bacterium]